MKGFIEFIQEQGVIGLAVGFILAAAVTKVVNSLVQDIINPIIGLALGSVDGLTSMVISIGGAEIMVGSFVSALIDFAIIALVVYILVKILRVDRLDKKNED